MATEEGVHSVQEISDAFVGQYFHILEYYPEKAHKFYVDDSVVSRPGSDGTMISFNSVEAINEQFLSGDFANMSFELLNVDSQNSLDDGIFITVIGFLTRKDNLRRKFSQMFYLARGNQRYNVINDMIRYVDEESYTPITLPVLEFGTEKVKLVDELNKTELIHKVADSVENSVNAAVTGPTAPLENGKIKHSEEAATAQQPKEPLVETVSPQLDGAKRSFAAIVQSMAGNATAFQVKVPVQKPKSIGQPHAVAAPQKPSSVSNSLKKNDQKVVEEPGTSIFVSNLPMNAMPPQLHELFKDFGPIKENGIQVRSSRGQANAVCFGFVAFESATSVQSVLQAAKNTPFMIADRKLRVKEKEVEYDHGSKPSGKPRGGSKTENGSADGGDEFKRVRNRRNGDRRRDRNANGDSNQKKQ